MDTPEVGIVVNVIIPAIGAAVNSSLSVSKRSSLIGVPNAMVNVDSCVIGFLKWYWAAVSGSGFNLICVPIRLLKSENNVLTLTWYSNKELHNDIHKSWNFNFSTDRLFTWFITRDMHSAFTYFTYVFVILINRIIIKSHFVSVCDRNPVVPPRT